MGGVVIFMNCNNHSDMRSIVLLINHRERTIFIRTIMAAIVDDKLCTIYLIHEEPVQLFLPAAALMDMLPKMNLSWSAAAVLFLCNMSRISGMIKFF